MDRWVALVQKPVRIVLGLMSGTSLDGLDLGLYQIRGAGLGVQMTELAFSTLPYPKELRQSIAKSLEGSVADLCRLNLDLGWFYAHACQDFLAQTGYRDRLDLVGHHGQTIYHIHGHSSLQTGEAAVLAQVLGVPVVSDFRLSDIAAGGAGRARRSWRTPASGSRSSQRGVATGRRFSRKPLGSWPSSRGAPG